jgi:hypothetical protein
MASRWKMGDQLEFTVLRDGREIIIPVTLEILD